MPGTPDPVLGSDALTLAVACASGALATAVPHVLRERLPAPSRVALVGGLGYAAACLAAWAGARFATGAWATATPRIWALVISAGVVVLSAQAAIPYYLYARWRLVGPLAGLFAVTTLVVDIFLHVRGETDPLGLYALFFGPVVVVTIGVLGAVELGVRRFVSRRNTE
ncbi:hypothetical protein [Halorussus amylolyticus]|uniref:hypothetical protein n=1 Tax=Halorussus amylolyticus TaxID=1126242 RepID=UPI001043FECE|nr:hypothetical protein [Halorussus amylolyticus]